jgi:hypothetical protein
MGDPAGETPLTPPAHWRTAERPDGSRYSGTSLHPPATAENVAALRQLAAVEPDAVFLDDDFRLATGPGVIGGCFCAEHRRRFLALNGHAAADWETLLDDVAARRLTPLLCGWCDMHCDELTASFRRQQEAIPSSALGTMIMYLGAEKAGIRLGDYRGVPLRPASGVAGIESLSINLAPDVEQPEPRRYTVRLHFGAPPSTTPEAAGQRAFAIQIQGRQVHPGLNLAVGPTRSVTLTFENVMVADRLNVTFTPHEQATEPPLVSGIEVRMAAP